MTRKESQKTVLPWPRLEHLKLFWRIDRELKVRIWFQPPQRVLLLWRVMVGLIRWKLSFNSERRLWGQNHVKEVLLETVTGGSY